MNMIRGLLSKMLLMVIIVAVISLAASFTFVSIQQKRALDENIQLIKESHRRSAKTLFENFLSNQILPFTEELVRLGGVAGSDPDNVHSFLRENWPRIKVTFSFESMSFSKDDKHYNFGRFPTQEMREQQFNVETTMSPRTNIICHAKCELATTVPVLSNKQNWSLSVLTEMGPSIDLLSNIINSDVIVLLPGQKANPVDYTLTRYTAISEFMTGQERLTPIFQLLLTPEQIEQLETEGLQMSAGDKDYYIWFESLEGVGDNLDLIFVRDMSVMLSQQREQKQQVIITFVAMTLGVLLFLMLFSIIPISKINQLKRAIKLIGAKEYNIARYRLGKARRTIFPDELDDLEDEFRTAIDVLESYEQELSNSQKRLVRQATIDSITGLFTRNVLIEDLANMNREQHVSNVAIFFLDLDGFKPVNDNLGHEAGDIMLKKIGYRLKGVINKFIRVYRIGGDEFVICFTNYSDNDALVKMADQVVELFAAPFHVYDTSITISASIGIAKQKAVEIEPDILLRYADIAMYQAKEEGKNRYKFFDESMRENTQQRFIIKNDFSSSLADGQLFVVFQPIVTSQSRVVTKLEALCRWKHPTLGFIPPLVFIDVLEESENMNTLFEWIVDNVIGEIRYLDGIGLDDIIVSINLSTSQLVNDTALLILDSKLSSFDIEPHRIEIEITETSLISNFNQAKKWIDKAKEIGFRIAIDDFGAGYSSLSYLTAFPFDTVKLDRSLLNNIDKDVRQQRIVGSLTQMLHGLSVPIVAEGAETEEHFEQLKLLGCDYIQGYLVCRPVEHEALVDFLQHQH
ncbi:putative bifunctional diguanylate cyclase/phosphodiesterase [Glaciecola sp. 1036]|uniref:putative bifunctional diguanylate cyclase/phosphodiesterase n=1 Tax=Alteromonadaceae TaxID=72275 RepID=UPI003D050C9A